MKDKIDIVLQALLGLIFFIFGLNGFLNFLPMPEMNAEAGSFMGALDATGYFFPVLKTVETVSGLLLLIRVFAPLALVLLAPVVVQILMFHVFLDSGNIVMAILLVVLEAYLGFGVYRKSFEGVLKARP